MHNYTSTSWFYILHSSFKSSMHVWCTNVLWACGMQVNICVYAVFILGSGISVDSAPALQAL